MYEQKGLELSQNPWLNLVVSFREGKVSSQQQKGGSDM